jgi:uncharacterized membrane protein YsdA (DUF1294 family)
VPRHHSASRLQLLALQIFTYSKADWNTTNSPWYKTKAQLWSRNLFGGGNGVHCGKFFFLHYLVVLKKGNFTTLIEH